MWTKALTLALYLTVSHVDQHLLGSEVAPDPTKSNTSQPSLTPYNQYESLLKNIDRTNPIIIQAFLTQYENTPVANRLRTQWLLTLAQKKQWPLYLLFYKPTNSATLNCLELTALYETGQKDIALQRTKDLWLVGYTQPKACDEVFTRWKKSGAITEKLIWQRLEMALENNQLGLASHLAATLPKDQEKTAQIWIQLHQQPLTITKIKFSQSSLAKRIIIHSLRRLARKNSKMAAKLWQKYSVTQNFSPEERHSIYSSLAFEFALDRDPQSKFWFEKLNPQLMTPILREWRIRSALLQHDWKTVKLAIEQLPATDQTNPCWQYWYAQACYQNGETEKAHSLFSTLAEERSYYGFLASAFLNQKPSLHDEKPSFTPEEFNHVKNMSGIQQSLMLYRKKQYSEARELWTKTINLLTPKEKYIAARLAFAEAWYDQAILTAKSANMMDDLQLRFPLAKKASILNAAKAHGLNPAALYALVRQESSFNQEAKSTAGAIGLMQLLPSTARQYFKKSHTKEKLPKELINQDINLDVGSAHMKELLKHRQGNYLLVAATYNAGGKQVALWMPKEPMPAPIWIETLPWQETRDYVKNFVSFFVIYCYRLGIEPDWKLILPDIHAKNSQ
ncbi:MAG: transglycosylase SLT domain-containing protein [Proteobacteria bacterium]|nr:transglycosylase SLT domain-containing protein [Pseudomonadota bacterium]